MFRCFVQILQNLNYSQSEQELDNQLLSFWSIDPGQYSVYD
jgi:hypothetical protein